MLGPHGPSKEGPSLAAVGRGVQRREAVVARRVGVLGPLEQRLPGEADGFGYRKTALGLRDTYVYVYIYVYIHIYIYNVYVYIHMYIHAHVGM